MVERSEKCPNCKEELTQVFNPRTSDGYTVCSEWCKDEWELDVKEGETE